MAGGGVTSAYPSPSQRSQPQGLVRKLFQSIAENLLEVQCLTKQTGLCPSSPRPLGSVGFPEEDGRVILTVPHVKTLEEALVLETGQGRPSFGGKVVVPSFKITSGQL